MNTPKNQGFDLEDGEKSSIEDTHPEIVGMSMVRQEHEKLIKTIEGLEGRRVIETKKYEAVFLELYKSQLQIMKKNFETLRHDIEEKENAIENNALVKKLSSERAWYKNEAFKLNEDIEKMKKRVETLEDAEKDRKWLSDQLKTVLKQKTELERLLETKALIF
jgi:hypothetical protein